MLQFDAVDISDDEDSFLLENDAGVTLKDENSGYDLPPLNSYSRPREVWLILDTLPKKI